MSQKTQKCSRSNPWRGSPKAGSPRWIGMPRPGCFGRTPWTGSHQHGTHTVSSQTLEAPGEILTLWKGHTIPGSAQGSLPALLLSFLYHSRILVESQALPRTASSPGTQGHDGCLIAGGISQLLEVFVVVVMDSGRQPPPHLPPPLWLKACQDGSTTVEHKDSAWFLWRSHPDLPSDPTSSLILGIWGCRPSTFQLL